MRGTTDITENITQINRLHFVNAYLVREPDGLTLVDTTTSGAAAHLIDVAKQAGEKIRRILLTHGHGDHVGSLDALRERLGEDVEVLMGEADARIHAGERPEGKLRGSWPTIRTRPDRLLRGGERIGSLEVIPSPGHTPGHVALLDVRDRTLLAGDTYTTYWRAEIPNRMSQRFPFASMGTQDRGLLLESARALSAMRPEILAAGHGPAVADPATAMEAATQRAGRV